jgi:L-seryl-tRNA(Ser) seleniumtransferase
MFRRDIFNRLPSVNELLESTQLRSVLDRVPVRDVTQRTRRFLDRVYREVERRSADFSVPSISELAERAVKYLLNEHETQPHVAINATGQLWDSRLPSPPIAHEAAQRVQRLADGYWQIAAGRADVEQRLAKLTGAEAALVLNSHAAAVCVALASLAPGGAAIARGDIGTLAGGIRVSDLAKLAGCPLHEVGASDEVALDDYRQVSATVANVIQVDLNSAAAGQSSQTVECSKLTEAVHRNHGVLVHALGSAPLVAIDAVAHVVGACTAAAAISSGTDIVIVRGDGWLGGPSCGIVLGSKRLVDAMATTAVARMAAASAETVAALAGTLDCYLQAESAVIKLPLLALATAPQENLKTRAERLAPQIAAIDEVDSASVVEISPEAAPPGMPRLASVGIEVIAKQSAAAKLRRRLAESTPAVVLVDLGERWLLNLRTVLPSQDMALVEAFLPAASEVAAQQPDAEPHPTGESSAETCAPTNETT